MLQIKDIFQLKPLQNLKFYAGHRGQNRVINTVTIMDIPEIADWLSGGELVIAGVLFQQCFSRSLVDSFLQKNIAGIVTKQKFLGEIPSDLIKYCNETGFPVLLAPETYNWGQVMNPIVTDMIRKPYLVIEENQNFHYSLMKSMIEGRAHPEAGSRTASVFRVFHGQSGQRDRLHLYLYDAAALLPGNPNLPVPDPAA